MVCRTIADLVLPQGLAALSAGFAEVLAQNSIGRHVPDTPLLWWHGMWDELIPPDIILPTVDDYWNACCA